jgi:tetratricopeptide (TPR) repeat protein
VLIWVGQKPFIDSRLGMYGSAGSNIGELHRKLRLALRQRVPGDDRTGQRAVWHAAFEEYNISHVLPRLSGRRPNYETFFDLMSDPEREWRLVRLGAASAAMYWNRPGDKELAVYLAAHPGADFLRQAFPRDETAEDPPALSLIAPPREPSWYDRLLILPQNVISNEVQLARHYIQLRIVLASRISPDNGASLTLLAIRHARRGLVNEPNSSDAYQTLAACYLGLSELERYLDPTGGSAIGPLRMRQALAALYNAVKCNPDDANAQMTLYQVLLATGKPDLALPHLREVQRITGTLTNLPADDERGQEEIERNREQMAQLTTQIETVRKELRQSLQSDAENNNRLEVVQGALSRGLPGEALQLLEEDQTIVAQNASVQMLMADLLLDAGRVEDALGQLEPMSAIMLQQNPAVASRWRNATALANIAAGNYERARILLNEDADAATDMRLQSVLGTSPRLGEVPGISTAPFTHAPADVADMRGISRATLAADLLYGYPQQWNRDQFVLAACDMEDGRNRAAVKRLDDILQRDPESELRPVTAFYLTTMTGQAKSFTPPSQEIPISGEMFADDAETGPAAESGAAVETTESDVAPSITDEPALPPPPPSSERRDADSTP